MVKIAVSGALGRMGNRILNLAYKSPDFKIAGAFEHPKSEYLGKDLGGALGLGETLKIKVSKLSAATLKGADVLIDFSSVDGVRESLVCAQSAKAALVVGTTGLGAELEAEIRHAAKKIPILFSPNMSIGANFLFAIARLAAEKLSAGYDIEIVEAHHRMKKDAPSGTAKKIAELIAKEKGWEVSKIPVHSIRAGDIVGEHTAYFSGPGETIELTHRAQSRDAFARGALVAALFLSKKKNGLYSMADVLK